MHILRFALSIALLSAVHALPVPQSIDSTTSTADPLSSSLSPTAISVNATDSAASAVSASATFTADAVSSSLNATATAADLPPLASDSAAASSTDDFPPPTVTDSPSLNATAIDSSSSVTDDLSSVALATDTSLPTATDSADTSDTDGASAPLAFATAAPTALSFTMPVVPSACAALPSGLPVSDTSLDPSATFTAASAAFSDDSNSDLPSSSSFSTLTAPPPAASSDASSVSSSVVDASSSVLSSAALNETSIAVSSDSLVSPSASSSAAIPTITSTATNTSALIRRIAQADLPSVAQSWQDLCLVSGGDIFTNEPCVNLAGINGINALLADADPCDQQDNADAMIDFARSPGVTNTDALIANAIAYRAHPRNALNINGVVPSTPYCQRAPRNPELVDVVNAQLDGVNPGIFGGPKFGLVAFGDSSSCPLGTTPDVTTCGCS